MEKFGLSEAEARFLFIIGLGGGERKISELIDFSGKHKSTVRQKLSLLEKKLLINVSSCSQDKREKNVSFTKKGEKLFQKILKINNSYQKKIFKKFTNKELETLLKLLNKLTLDNI
jgi:DNA-binding MarR family transcriptional regulator